MSEEKDTSAFDNRRKAEDSQDAMTGSMMATLLPLGADGPQIITPIVVGKVRFKAYICPNCSDTHLHFEFMARPSKEFGCDVAYEFNTGCGDAQIEAIVKAMQAPLTDEAAEWIY